MSPAQANTHAWRLAHVLKALDRMARLATPAECESAMVKVIELAETCQVAAQDARE